MIINGREMRKISVVIFMAPRACQKAVYCLLIIDNPHGWNLVLYYNSVYRQFSKHPVVCTEIQLHTAIENSRRK